MRLSAKRLQFWNNECLMNTCEISPANMRHNDQRLTMLPSPELASKNLKLLLLLVMCVLFGRCGDRLSRQQCARSHPKTNKRHAISSDSLSKMRTAVRVDMNHPRVRPSRHMPRRRLLPLRLCFHRTHHIGLYIKPRCSRTQKYRRLRTRSVATISPECRLRFLLRRCIS